MNDAGLMSLLRKLEMTEKRQTQALDETRAQIETLRESLRQQDAVTQAAKLQKK